MDVGELKREKAKKVRKHSRKRADLIRGTVCYVCHAVNGHEVHHVLPIRYGGSYGHYNLMSTCRGWCHSILNKISNYWCRKHMPDLMHLTVLQRTRILKKYIDARLNSRKSVQRVRKASDLEGLDE